MREGILAAGTVKLRPAEAAGQPGPSPQREEGPIARGAWSCDGATLHLSAVFPNKAPSRHGQPTVGVAGLDAVPAAQGGIDHPFHFLPSPRPNDLNSVQLGMHAVLRLWQSRPPCLHVSLAD